MDKKCVKTGKLKEVNTRRKNLKNKEKVLARTGKL